MPPSPYVVLAPKYPKDSWWTVKTRPEFQEAYQREVDRLRQSATVVQSSDRIIGTVHGWI